MSINWWRSWHGAPTDHKWAVVAARSGVKTGIVSAIAWAMLDYASQNADRGSIEGFDPEEYAVYSGFDEASIIAVRQAMHDKGILINNRFSNWEKRQPKREDDSSERVTRFRELKRSVTQSNASDKDKDKDKDTEADTEREGERAFPNADAGAWQGELPPPPPPAKPDDFENMTVRQAQEVPEIQLIVRATGWMPGKPVWRLVVETIRAHKLSEETIRKCHVTWSARGFKRDNIAWLTDWSVNGIPALRTNAAAPKNGKPSPNDILEALAEAERRLQ